jgi:23S rRNA (uracil1939-C5)-methyltransferase
MTDQANSVAERLVTITRLGHQGDGIADGPIFAPRTLPGEVIEGAVSGDRIEAPRIVTPSPDRIKPPCAHYKACGGCGLLHARESFVTDWKQGVIAQALAAQGLEAAFLPAHTSPLGTRRRATFAGRRLKKGALVGFHARASDVVTDVPGCIILHPDLVGALPLLRELTAEFGSRKGELALALTRSDTGLDLHVTGGKDADGVMRAELGAWAGRVGLARLTWGDEVVALARPPLHQLGRAQVCPPPGAFLQATLPAQAALQAAVAQAAGGAARVADLFAGCGTFALPLAESAQVHAVEGSAPMLAALDAGWRGAQGLKRVSTEARDLFRRPLLPDELASFDAVVIDPPRAGAEAQMHALAASKVASVAAVSCNPVTFARDAKILTQAGFRLNWVQMVDQFRFSPHVELAASFTR